MKNGIILLTPRITELTEAIIRPIKPKTMMLGYYHEKTFFKRAGPGGNKNFNIFLNHIKNISGQEGIVNKLYFDLYVDLFEKSNSKVRIRVLSVGEDGLPKDDILTKEIIKTVDRLTPNLITNVTDFNIVFPPEGVFIGLEFFCSFESKKLKKEGHSKNITDCPHIPSAKISNFNELGNSFALDKVNGKIQWVCWSDGSYWGGLKGHVFKFGAEVSQ